MTFQSFELGDPTGEHRDLKTPSGVLRVERHENGWRAEIDGERVVLPNLKNFTGLFDEPELAISGFDWLLASAPELYLGRLSGEEIVIGDVTCGDFSLCFVDWDGHVDLADVILDGGDERLDAPGGALYLFLRRTSR